MNQIPCNPYMLTELPLPYMATFTCKELDKRTKINVSPFNYWCSPPVKNDFWQTSNLSTPKVRYPILIHKFVEPHMFYSSYIFFVPLLL